MQCQAGVRGNPECNHELESLSLFYLVLLLLLSPLRITLKGGGALPTSVLHNAPGRVTRKYRRGIASRKATKIRRVAAGGGLRRLGAQLGRRTRRSRWQILRLRRWPRGMHSCWLDNRTIRESSTFRTEWRSR